jgi:hypothetical protein
VQFFDITSSERAVRLPAGDLHAEQPGDVTYSPDWEIRFRGIDSAR